MAAGMASVSAGCFWLQSGIAFSSVLAEPERFQWPEVGLVLALALVSGALFFSRLEPILGRILRSKKDADFSIAPVGRRVWEFVWEVLCQGKVIKQRPLPGMAHAFVFWGFLAFALVSLNHFATGVRLGFLQHAESYVGRFYFWFAAVWALLVAVSIAGLFVRRFFVRPVWLGEKVSYESGFIALLIFVLMVTYLAAFFVPDGGAAVQGAVVGAHAGAAGVSAADSAHQAPAPRAEPADGVFEAGRVFEDPEAGWTTRTSGWSRARMLRS